jgi:hypothetical protein
MVYSIYPVPEHVLDGTLYDNLVSLISSAPPNSYLNTWHEALSLDYSQYPFITSDNMYQLHARMNTLVQQHATATDGVPNVIYGSIFGGGDGDLGMLFDSVPPDLGFYGLDLYAGGGPDCSSGIAAGIQHLKDFIDQAGPKDTSSAHYPKLVIPECNYSPDCSLLGEPEDPGDPEDAGNSEDPGDPTLRGQWFEAVANVMHQYGANSIGILTFWRDGGLDSGKWDPSKPWGHSTIDALNHIINTIF